MSKTSELRKGSQVQSNSQRIDNLFLASSKFNIVAIVANDEDNAYLLQEDHGEAVDLDGHDPGQGGQGDVCGHTDEGEVRDGHQQSEDRAEHTARGRAAVPVYQLFCGLLTINY